MGVIGWVLKFPFTNPKHLRVTVYDPLRGVPVAELEVLKKVSYATGKHFHGVSRVYIQPPVLSPKDPDPSGVYTSSHPFFIF